MVEFQKIVGSFITLVDDVAKDVEKEKMKVELISYVHHYKIIWPSTLQPNKETFCFQL